jgi:lipopolysaccharide transport system permease protein
MAVRHWLSTLPRILFNLDPADLIHLRMGLRAGASFNTICFALRLSMKTTTYTPGSQLSDPGSLVRKMLLDLLASRELAWRLIVRNFSAQYRQTALGYAWAFLPPLVTSLAFLVLGKSGVLNVGDIGLPMAAYILISTTLWQLFADAVNAPLRLCLASKAILTKLNFPREALILAGIGETLVSFLIRLVLIVGTFLWFRVPLHQTVILFPLGVLALLAFGTCVGILLTPIGMLYEDISKSLPVFLTFWMMLTPVVYAPASAGLRAQLQNMNPATPLLVVTRDWLTVGQTAHLGGFLLVTIATLVCLAGGWILYRLAMPHLIARLGG